MIEPWIKVLTDEMVTPRLADTFRLRGYDLTSCHAVGRANRGISDSDYDLRGTDRLVEDTCTQLWPRRVWHDEIHPLTEDLFQPYLDATEIEKVQRAAKFDQHVDIAIWPRFVASHGAEQRERVGAHRPQFVAVFGQQAQGFFTSHAGPRSCM